MKLQYTTGQKALRSEIREWLTDHVPEAQLASFDTEAGFAQHRGWERTLAAGKWSMGIWPKEFGGLGWDLIEWLIFEEEYWRARAPLRVNQTGILLLGPTLIEYGTDEQQRRFSSKTASGEYIWALTGFESSAGSDLAAIRATVPRDGDHAGTVYPRTNELQRNVVAEWMLGMPG